MKISEFKLEAESIEYDACSFMLNNLRVIYRSSKITPKKIGQFVTFWKRNKEEVTAPLHETDVLDFYVINVRKNKRFGQFVFPKSILISKGILSTDEKDGKRGFRVYPSWDVAINKQAIKTQIWQLDYFYEVGVTPLEKVGKLYR